MTEKNQVWKAEALDWGKSILIAIVIGLFIKTFIFNTTYVDGNSMNPTLENGDRLVTAKIVYYFSEPAVGDIIVLKAPDRDDADYIKRVLGVAGDKILIKDGLVYRNDELIEEEYIGDAEYTYGEYVEGETIIIPENQVLVVGDNRIKGASKDGRYFGPIDVSLVKSKAVIRYYPFDKFGGLN